MCTSIAILWYIDCILLYTKKADAKLTPILQKVDVLAILPKTTKTYSALNSKIEFSVTYTYKTSQPKGNSNAIFCRLSI